MIRTFAAWASIALLSSLLLGGGPTLCAEDGTQGGPLIEGLDAAHEAWLEDIEFSSAYEYWEGEARSIAQGLAGNTFRRELRHSGVFNKRGRTLRHSMRFSQPPRDASPQGNGMQVLFVPHDEVSDDRLRIHLADRPDKHSAAVAMVSLRDKDFASAPLDGLWRLDSLGPLCLSGGAYRLPCDIFRDPVLNHRIRRTARELPDSKVEIVCEGANDERRSVRKVVFWLEASPPVVLEITQTDWPTGSDEPDFQLVCRAESFVDCPGGKVPRVVRRVIESVRRIYVSEWISKDLGARTTTDDDFRITVPSYCRVGGVLDPPAKGTVRHLAPSDFADGELKMPRDPEPLIAPTGFPTAWGRPVRGLFGVVLVILAVGFAAWVWKRVR